MVNRFDSRPIVTFHYRDFPLGDLVEAKGDQVVSVCIPAHDEAATVGIVVDKLRQHLMERVPLIDEILVLDDHSSDGTAPCSRGPTSPSSRATTSDRWRPATPAAAPPS